jgi:tetratricopeptide (TPR) repeat protein
MWYILIPVLCLSEDNTAQCVEFLGWSKDSKLFACRYYGGDEYCEFIKIMDTKKDVIEEFTIWNSQTDWKYEDIFDEMVRIRTKNAAIYLKRYGIQQCKSQLLTDNIWHIPDTTHVVYCETYTSPSSLSYIIWLEDKDTDTRLPLVEEVKRARLVPFGEKEIKLFNARISEIFLSPDSSMMAIIVKVSYVLKGIRETAYVVHLSSLRKSQAKLWNNVGMKYYKLKNYEKASKCFEYAVNLYPEYGMAVFNLSCTYSLLGKYEDSLTYLEKAININPGFFRKKAKEDKDFDSIRYTDKFLKLIYNYSPDMNISNITIKDDISYDIGTRSITIELSGDILHKIDNISKELGVTHQAVIKELIKIGLEKASQVR